MIMNQQLDGEKEYKILNVMPCWAVRTVSILVEMLF